MNRFPATLLTGLALTTAISAQSTNHPQEWARLSPFTAVKPAANSAIVRYEGRDYELISINGQRIAEILSFCQRTYRNWWEKRFTEDLVEVLAAIGHPMTPQKTVTLLLKDPVNGRVTTIDHAPMTAQNRDAAFLFRQQNRKDHPDWPR